MGVIDGIKGVFPSNFVEVIEDEFDASNDDLMLLKPTEQLGVSFTSGCKATYVLFEL